jgi:hypothetical protein
MHLTPSLNSLANNNNNNNNSEMQALIFSIRRHLYKIEYVNAELKQYLSYRSCLVIIAHHNGCRVRRARDQII